MSARTNILTRLHLARAGARLPRASAPETLPPTPRSGEACIARFADEARLLGIDCFFESSAADVGARLLALVNGHAVLSWDADQLPYDVGALIPNASRGTSPRHEQSAAGVGVTGCDAAIAETASLALFSRPGRSRPVSLLPPVHIAIVQPQQFCYSMAEFFAAHAGDLCTAASCTFITGPSRTADIELTLTLGIHGPGRVVVIVGP